MANDKPIGVFDSGFGGLSVLQNIRQQLPFESLIYVADSHYVPYGDKETDFIIERCLTITQYLLQQSIKTLVIACNTATAAAAEVLRERYRDLPILALEPAIKPACKATQTRKIGVLATRSTLKSTKFADLLARFADGIEIIAQPCSGLADCIEKGDLMGEATKQLLMGYLQPLLDTGCDTIILGCTHYPFLRPLMAQLLPPHVLVIDSGKAVTRNLKNTLASSGSLATEENDISMSFLTTGDVDVFKSILAKLWLDKISCTQHLEL